jgi:hypothetical protein
MRTIATGLEFPEGPIAVKWHEPGLRLHHSSLQ